MWTASDGSRQDFSKDWEVGKIRIRSILVSRPTRYGAITSTAKPLGHNKHDSTLLLCERDGTRSTDRNEAPRRQYELSTIEGSRHS